MFANSRTFWNVLAIPSFTSWWGRRPTMLTLS